MSCWRYGDCDWLLWTLLNNRLTCRWLGDVCLNALTVRRCSDILALCVLDAMNLLVILLNLNWTTLVLDLLMVDIVYLDLVIDQIMMIVCILDNDTLCVPVISVDVRDDRLGMLMVEAVFSRDCLLDVEIKRDCPMHGRLLNFDVHDLGLCDLWLHVASIVRWWQQQAADVKRRWFFR